MTYPRGFPPADLHIVSELDLLRLQRGPGLQFGLPTSYAHPALGGPRQDLAFELVQDELDRREFFMSGPEAVQAPLYY